MSYPIKTVDPQSIENSIQMLKRHLGDEEITPLLAVLEALAKDPQNATLGEQLSDVFGGLGILQGAVLTYAPCIAIILSDNLFNDPE
ncbi:MAG: hypothetical protein ACFCVA_16330 [Gammaproteobacteria bacterium]